MDSKKIAIIVLVIVAILFVVGQGGGVMRDDKSDKNPDQDRQKAISDEQSDWTGAIKGGLGWMNLLEKVDIGRISTWNSTANGGKCSAKVADNHLVLTMNAKCELSASIEKAGDEQELNLAVIEGCGQSRDFKRTNRISTVIAANPQIVTGRVIAQPGGGTHTESSDKKSWPKLTVSYKPADGDTVSMQNPWDCGKELDSLIIVPGGGGLKLKCDQCSEEHSLKLRIN